MLGYSILSGTDGIDGYAIYDKDIDASTRRMAGRTLRVGWVSDDAFGPVEREVTGAVVAAAAHLADLGCEVEQVEVPFLNGADAQSALLAFVYSELIPYVTELTAGREHDLFPTSAAIIAIDEPTVKVLRAARSTMEGLRSAFARYFTQYDVLMCPVTPVTARPHGLPDLTVDGVTAPWSHVADATAPFNLTGLPAISVPYGFSSGQLPIGIQLVSQWFDESTLLRLGALIERKGGLGDRRPPIVN